MTSSVSLRAGTLHGAARWRDQCLVRRAAQDLDIAFGGSDKRGAELLAEERDKAQAALKVRCSLE